MSTRERYDMALSIMRGWDQKEKARMIDEYVAELEAALAAKDEALRATMAGQETLIQCIADLKGEEEKLAREAWKAAREFERIDLGDGETIEGRHCRWSEFDDWWRERGGK